MKIHKSTIQKNPINTLPQGKIRITMKGTDSEGIWVAIDKENKLMYLLNHAVMFWPVPSWGMELPMQSTIDLYPYRKDTLDETEFTACEETYEALKDFIDENDEFDHARYHEFVTGGPATTEE